MKLVPGLYISMSQSMKQSHWSVLLLHGDACMHQRYCQTVTRKLKYDITSVAKLFTFSRYWLFVDYTKVFGKGVYVTQFLYLTVKCAWHIPFKENGFGLDRHWVIIKPTLTFCRYKACQNKPVRFVGNNHYISRKHIWICRNPNIIWPGCIIRPSTLKSVGIVLCRWWFN